jgi:ankyrin repeat protein
MSQAVIDKIVTDFVANEAEALLNEQPEEQDEPMVENNTNQPSTEGMDVEPEKAEGEDEPTEEVKIKEIKDVPYIDVPDMFGRTALHYAAEFGHAEVAKLLIRRGASLEVLDKVKMTPLAVAAQQGHFECVKVLVEGGANIEARDKVRRTPLVHAVKNGSVTVASYLVHMGADPNTSDSSINTAVHYAAAFGWNECLKYLISVGADANANNLWKTSPLAIAMMKGHLACADILLDQKGVDVNVRNDDGDTLVIQVLRLSHPSTLAQVRFLVQDKKADINLTDRSGQYPLIIAIRSKSQHRKFI